MLGFSFSKYVPPPEGDPFERLLRLFMELIQYTAGDVDEALAWLTELDKQHGLTDNDYGLGDFIRDLRDRGYVRENDDRVMQLTARSEQTIRRSALDEIFGKLKKSRTGTHRTPYTGEGDEPTADLRPYRFGDAPDAIDMTGSLRNAQINHGLDEFSITEEDLEIREKEYKTRHATVLMIDISHSMILYGEDRITPARKTAMALAELIRIKYPKDSLDVIAFGDDARLIEVKDLPYLMVGPYHTNTSAGLKLAMDLLRRRKTPNRQIFMITDGKPTCMTVGGRHYKNSFGLDRRILADVFGLAAQCKKLKIPITTFMIASDPYLQQFVREFTRTNNGRAFYSSLNGLGEYVFEDYVRNRKKNV